MNVYKGIWKTGKTEDVVSKPEKVLAFVCVVLVNVKTYSWAFVQFRN